MAIPANDAFTLHDASPRRTRTLSRSPSPKIFPSSRSSARPPVTSTDTNSVQPRRALRRATSTQHLEGVVEVDDPTPPASPAAKKKRRSSAKKEDKPKAADAIDWEIPRKSLHSSIGFLTLRLYTSNSSPKFVVLSLCVALAVIVPADVLRLRYPAFARLYERFLGFLMRDCERHKVNGTIWYILGVLYVLALLPLDIAVVSILILSWADTAASTIGRLWGRHTRRLPSPPFAPRKSLAGFLAATVTGSLVALAFWKWVAPARALLLPSDVSWRWDEGVSVGNLGGPALSQVGGAVKQGLTQLGVVPTKAAGWLGLGAITVVAGLVSGVAEALDIGSLDDNLTLPVISGTCLWGFFKLLEFISA